ncbi:MAG TPA: bifunctional 4-hydroxy-2-oxoglutarate aldolase/2-dehydro-3-deoxy-phosphogluconate aldolase [Puia sp.]|nr:bifunctional 4-hydroxy-2-oxoglutarate aldolase/2-dehydro-3-deoxy-phosphogluconate aldolase [Puia sp.]
MTTLEQIFEHKIVAILRGCNPANIVEISQALYEGGIRLLEITLNSPGALDAIQQVASQFGDRMVIGAGTVLTVDEANAAVTAGARFILSPSLDVELVRFTRDLGAVSVPGAFTATEILTAYRAGANIVKVFPASVGPAYFRDIRGPLPQIPLMPTGGVSMDNIRDFQKAGAVAFGVGSALVPASQGVTVEELEALRKRAAGYVGVIG